MKRHEVSGTIKVEALSAIPRTQCYHRPCHQCRFWLINLTTYMSPFRVKTIDLSRAPSDSVRALNIRRFKCNHFLITRCHAALLDEIDPLAREIGRLTFIVKHNEGG